MAASTGMYVVDVKTDPPPADDVLRVSPRYVEQVRLYSRLLEQSGVAEARPVRAALLFTGDGGLHWV